MVGEEGPAVDRPGLRLGQRGHAGEEVRPVPAVAEDGTPLQPPHHDVVEDPGASRRGWRGMVKASVPQRSSGCAPPFSKHLKSHLPRVRTGSRLTLSRG